MNKMEESNSVAYLEWYDRINEVIKDRRKRLQEKPRGLYHISEVLQELLGPDTLSTARITSIYETPTKYHRGQH